MRSGLAILAMLGAGLVGGVGGALLVRSGSSGLVVPVDKGSFPSSSRTTEPQQPRSVQAASLPTSPAANPNGGDERDRAPADLAARAPDADPAASSEIGWAKGWIPEGATIQGWIREAAEFGSLSDTDREYVLSCTFWLQGQVDELFHRALPGAGRELRAPYARGYAVASIPSLARAGRSNDSWNLRYETKEVSWATYMLNNMVDMIRINEEAERGEIRDWRRAFAKEHLTEDQAARLEREVEALCVKQRRSAAELEAHYRPLIEAGK